MAVALRPADAGLAPLLDTLAGVRARLGAAPVQGLAPGLVVDDPDLGGWRPATAYADGSHLPGLIDAARARWGGDRHVAAAVAVKSYVYWVTLPAVLGYASARRVPDMSAPNVLVRLPGVPPFVEVGLRRPGLSPATATDVDLLVFLRTTLWDAHLAPFIERVHEAVRLGRRTLAGSVASAVGLALHRASDVLPGSPVATARTILAALDLEDLVEIGTDEAGRPRIQRRTCCLAFALPTPKICAGCCIRR
jgi:ferric iron reductase protein FhuF